MESHELKSIIESLIFVSEEPITEKQLHMILEADGVTLDDIKEALNAMIESVNNDSSRGLQLAEVAGGYQFRTKESIAPWIQKLSIPKPVRLSQPSLETLSIIAYRQPIVRSEIEAIRGVDVGGVLKTLLERNLVRIIGRRDEPGQPLIYGTTSDFLELFGLKSLSELPPLSDIEDLAKRRVETETPSPLSLLAQNGEDDDDEEEPTEVIDNVEDDEDDDEEEATEIVKKKDEEGEEVLSGIEDSLKQLRRLEREIFSKDEEGESEQQRAPTEGVATPEQNLEAAGCERNDDNDSTIDLTEDETDPPAEDDRTVH